MSQKASGFSEKLDNDPAFNEQFLKEDHEGSFYHSLNQQ